ncbi:hypothetical protein AAG906_021833 [Vitis piasezkii]
MKKDNCGFVPSTSRGLAHHLKMVAINNSHEMVKGCSFHGMNRKINWESSDSQKEHCFLYWKGPHLDDRLKMMGKLHS